MYPSIPVSEFVDPERGTSAFNAICRALEIKPEVVPIGTYEDEKYFRVQSKGRPPHCVILFVDGQGDRNAKCDCPSHFLPSEPRACLHIAMTLIWETENNDG